jgi:hypothetical protein|tara:strand:- start:927 stop:1208 length:282 start_codon:yes stop_codon:yes gene_type:complete
MLTGVLSLDAIREAAAAFIDKVVIAISTAEASALLFLIVIPLFKKALCVVGVTHSAKGKSLFVFSSVSKPITNGKKSVQSGKCRDAKRQIWRK